MRAFFKAFAAMPCAILFAGILSLSCVGTVFAQDLPVAENGILSVGTVNLNEVRLPLNGHWNYYENQLLFPEECADFKGTQVNFPGLWRDEPGAKNGFGYGTYLLKVATPAGYTTLALEIPQIYSSYQLWVNGKLMASNGRVGRAKEETAPQWMPQTISFERAGDTVQIVLRMANFHHYNGGIKEPIYLGSGELMQRHRTIAEMSTLVECVTLLLTSILFAIIFFLKGRKKIVLYFAMLCFTWSIRSVFSNLYVFISFFPDFDWNAMVRTEYITLYFTMIWAILFLGRLFAREGNPIIKYLFVTGNVVFTVFTLLVPPVTFTRWLPLYLGFSVALLLYGIFVILWALINERVGAKTLLTTCLLGIGIFSYDIMTFKGWFAFNPVVFSAGYIFIFLLMTFALLLHLNIIRSKPKPSGMLRYDDLYRKEK